MFLPSLSPCLQQSSSTLFDAVFIIVHQSAQGIVVRIQIQTVILQVFVHCGGEHLLDRHQAVHALMQVLENLQRRWPDTRVLASLQTVPAKTLRVLFRSRSGVALAGFPRCQNCSWTYPCLHLAPSTSFSDALLLQTFGTVRLLPPGFGEATGDSMDW